MADDAPWYYTVSGSETIGPVPLERLREAVRDGRVVGDTAVWTPSFGQTWRRADSVAALRDAWVEVEAARVRAVSQQELRAAPLGETVAAALRHAGQAFFRPFSPLLWLSIALCQMLASSRMVAGVIDQHALLAGIKPDTDLPGLVGLFAGCLRTGLVRVFEPRVSASWVFLVILSCSLVAYLCAKGRLLLLGKAYAPREPLAAAWRRTFGRTKSLALFYASMDCLLNFALYTCLFRFFLAANFAEGPRIAPDALRAAILAPGPSRWLAAATGVVLAIEFVRSFCYHFVEPLVSRFAVPVPTGFAMALRAASRDPWRFVAYYAFVIAFRAAYLLVAFVLVRILGASFALVLFDMLLLLPLDYFFRVAGAIFIRNEP